ncbi:uncharacterized protein LOC107494410 [Arachis duranensis]|uniref:Uncharacterized protein LOC107494410 n=1 Tax=Arachis duranensis TaxID=130453 RepID=A0A9C6WKD1_ARADU|nr:uncharacterized protein LOC107494410 [Arachis duranensis]
MTKGASSAEENIFEWKFAIRGPCDTEFEGGIYHGQIQLPAEYSFKPLSFMLLTVRSYLILQENEQGIFDAILCGRIDFSSDPWPSISSSAKDLVKMLHADAKEWLSAVEVQVRGGQLWETDVYTYDSDLVACYCRPTASPPPTAIQELCVTICMLQISLDVV